MDDLVESLERATRVRSGDYGDGTVLAIMGNTILVWWDTPLTGTSTHQLGHDRAYVETLERL